MTWPTDKVLDRDQRYMVEVFDYIHAEDWCKICTTDSMPHAKRVCDGFMQHPVVSQMRIFDRVENTLAYEYKLEGDTWITNPHKELSDNVSETLVRESPLASDKEPG